MKGLKTVITEKLKINKDTKFDKPKLTNIDAKTCCIELYKLMDEIYNDKSWWNATSYDPDEERDDFFNNIIHGDRSSCITGLLDELVDRECISDKDADKYYNDIRVLDFCEEIAIHILNGKNINVNKIYHEVAY